MIGAPELLMTAFMVVVPVVSLYFAYWVIRLAVRHGMEDVFDRQALERGSSRPLSAPLSAPLAAPLDDRLDRRESDHADQG
jgi:hypothetical protein